MSFQYSPLDIKKQEIRLLILQPRSYSDTIHAQLQPCSLTENNVDFEALSYTWGSPLPRQFIDLNSQSFSVNPSLHVALSHLRHSTASRTLWIDALCINQEDLREREEQVGQMRLIYQSAKRVLIWLGEEEDESSAAMDLVNGIEALDLRLNNLEMSAPAGWNALCTLLQRPWWNRVWIIQEVAVGRTDPLVGCGERWIPWSKFEAFDELFGDLEEAGMKFVQGVENPISRLRNIRGGMQGRRKMNWKDLSILLRATHGCQATDARDKVFALLGLSSDRDQDAIRPDYTSSVVEVYTAVARYLIQSEEGLNSLIYFKPIELPGLPSWVTDFTSSDGHRAHLRGAPSKETAAGGKPVVEFIGDDKIKIRGWIVDEVREVSTELFDEDNPILSVSAFEQLARKTLPENPTSAQVKILIDRFWRCLIADRTMWREFPAPDSYAHLYSVLCGEGSVPNSFEPENTDPKARKDAYLWPLTAGMLGTLPLTKFFITRDGRFGIGPLDTKEGDQVVTFQGADVPFILRSHGNEGMYCLLREAYLSGLGFRESPKGSDDWNAKDGYVDFVIC